MNPSILRLGKGAVLIFWITECINLIWLNASLLNKIYAIIGVIAIFAHIFEAIYYAYKYKAEANKSDIIQILLFGLFHLKAVEQKSSLNKTT